MVASLTKPRLTAFLKIRGAGVTLVKLSTLITAFPASFTKVSWSAVAVAWSTHVTFPERQLLPTSRSSNKEKSHPMLNYQ